MTAHDFEFARLYVQSSALVKAVKAEWMRDQGDFAKPH
jgi:hypothetical protein